MKPTLALATATAVLASLVVSAPAADAVQPREPRAAAPYDIKPFTTYPKDVDRLERAWAAWLERDVDRYVTVVTRYCFCIEEPDVRTRVRGDRVTSVRHVGEREQLDRRGHEIETFYRLLRRAFREAHSVDVRFRDGVPVRIFVDWEQMMADEEIAYRVRLRER